VDAGGRHLQLTGNGPQLNALVPCCALRIGRWPRTIGLDARRPSWEEGWAASSQRRPPSICSAMILTGVVQDLGGVRLRLQLDDDSRSNEVTAI